MPEIVRCPSCAGYGWQTDDFSGEDHEETCTWCNGAGYVYQDADGVQHRIPNADYGAAADKLEALERERLREIGYTGEAKRPWEQTIRRDTRGGLHPDERDDD
jgi:hypothetical protein